VVYGDRVPFDREQDAMDAATTSIKHLAKLDPQHLVFLLRDGMAERRLLKSGDRSLEPRLPTRGGRRRTLRAIQRIVSKAVARARGVETT
jgi:hypothetical protein